MGKACVCFRCVQEREAGMPLSKALLRAEAKFAATEEERDELKAKLKHVRKCMYPCPHGLLESEATLRAVREALDTKEMECRGNNECPSLTDRHCHGCLVPKLRALLDGKPTP